MELLDRYLQAVKRGLPKAQQDDIIQELSENLRSQIEDREADLGRPLTEPELKALLQQHGAPIAVAGRYRPGGHGLAFGRQLIGPVLFPYYLKVLALNLGITLIASIFIALALPTRQALSIFLGQVLLQFGIITAIFAMVEIHVSRSPEGWHFLSPGPLKQDPTEKRANRNPRLEAIGELIFLALFFRLLWAVPGIHPAKAIFRLAPVWHLIYLPILLLTAGGMVQAAICLVRPRWTRFRAAARVVAGAAWLVLLSVLVTSQEWVGLADGSGSGASEYARVVANINHYFFWGLCVSVMVSALILYLDVRRLVRECRRSSGKTPGLGTPQYHST